MASESRWNRQNVDYYFDPDDPWLTDLPWSVGSCWHVFLLHVRTHGNKRGLCPVVAASMIAAPYRTWSHVLRPLNVEELLKLRKGTGSSLAGRSLKHRMPSVFKTDASEIVPDKRQLLRTIPDKSRKPKANLFQIALKLLRTIRTCYGQPPLVRILCRVTATATVIPILLTQYCPKGLMQQQRIRPGGLTIRIRLWLGLVSRFQPSRSSRTAGALRPRRGLTVLSIDCAKRPPTRR